jgi:outer membrane lipoprotein-sorting protein
MTLTGAALAEAPAPPTPTSTAPTRVASRAAATAAGASAATAAARDLAPAPSVSPVVDLSLGDPIAAARRAIADCQARFARVDDYTCTFVKRERVGGTLHPAHVMQMKSRSKPTSFYLQFKSPNKGREAIYVAGRHKNQVVAHDVGLFKVLAGTMLLDPKGSMAMEDCRHPITEAGIGALVETVARHWALELTTGETQVTFDPHLRIGPAACTMVETVHPARQPHFLFHKVRLYIDHAHGLPIRFEAYDWPKRPGAPAELVEEYTYLDLRLNVGLTDHDFDPNNRAYSFGRF